MRRSDGAGSLFLTDHLPAGGPVQPAPGKERLVPEASLNDLRDDIESLRRDLAALQRDARGYAGGVARRGSAAVRHRAESALDSARHVADQAESVYDEGLDYVRRNPAVSVLVAVGVGAVVARLLTSNRR